VDTVKAGLPQSLEALLVEDEPGVLDAVASVNRRDHLLGSGHLRDAVVSHEADRLDPRQTRSRKLVDELGAHRGRERVRLVLEPVARADVAEGHGHLETVRTDVLRPDADQKPVLARLRLPTLARVLARELVDVLVRAVACQLRDAANGDPAIAVAAVDDEHAHARVAFEVARLDPAGRGVEDDVLTVPVDPDDA